MLPMNALSDEILLEILAHVPPLDVLRSAALTNRRFASLTTSRDGGDGRYWRSHPCLPETARRRTTTTTGGIAPLTLRQLQILCCICSSDGEDTSSSGSSQISTARSRLPRSLRGESVLPTREAAYEMAEARPRGGGRCCIATSTDHGNERLENVLRLSPNIPSAGSSSSSGGNHWDDIVGTSDEPDLGPPRPSEMVPTIQFIMAAMHQNGTYWSSAPSPQASAVTECGREQQRTSEETLAFATLCEDAVVQDVAVKPFRELRLEGDHQPYTWPAAKVRVYRLPVGATATGTTGGAETPRWESGTIAGLDGGHVGGNEGDHRGSPSAMLLRRDPVYESEVCDAPPANDCRWQHFRLPKGVVGNVVTVTLLGKNYRQYPESGYYVCVDRVAVRGVPLAAHWDDL